MTDRPHRSIGEVLHLLESEFPEVTISKIRFLESQGLLNPERTPSGYRMFFDADVARLRWILVQQRDNFLPLRVIKKRLDSGDWDPNDVAPLATGQPAPESTTFARVVEPVAAEPAAVEGVVAETAALPDDTPQVVQLDATAAAAEAVDTAAPVADPALNGAEPSADDATYLGFEEEDVAAVDDPAPAPEPVAAAVPEVPAAPPQSAPVVRAQPAAEPAAPAPVAAEPVAPAPAPEPVAPAPVAAEPAPAPAPAAPEPAPAPAAPAAPEPAPAPAAPAAPAPAPAAPAPAAVAPAAAAAPVAPAPAAEAPAVLAAPAASMHEPLHPLPPELEPEPEPEPDPSAVLAGSQAEIAFSITELAEAANLDVTDLRELQRFGIIEAINDDQVPTFDADALMVARASAAFMSHGLEPRHLKAWRVAAEREAGVLEQLTLPVAKQNSAGASRRALELANDLVSMGSDLRYAMLRRALRKTLKFD